MSWCEEIDVRSIRLLNILSDCNFLSLWTSLFYLLRHQVDQRHPATQCQHLSRAVTCTEQSAFPVWMSSLSILYDINMALYLYLREPHLTTLLNVTVCCSLGLWLSRISHLLVKLEALHRKSGTWRNMHRIYTCIEYRLIGERMYNTSHAVFQWECACHVLLIIWCWSIVLLSNYWELWCRHGICIRFIKWIWGNWFWCNVTMLKSVWDCFISCL